MPDAGGDAARVTLELGEDGRPQRAWFDMNEFSGLAGLARGRHFTEMPSLVSRLYGICPVSHLLAATEACEQISGVVVPEAALELRGAAGLGEIVQSHALGVLHLTSARGLFGLLPTEGAHEPDPSGVAGLVQDAVTLRRFGQLVVDEIAGRRRHYEAIVIGGLGRLPAAEACDTILAAVPGALDAARRSLDFYRETVASLAEEAAQEGAPGLFLGLVSGDGSAAYEAGRLRVVDGEGRQVAEMADPRAYEDFLGRSGSEGQSGDATYWKDLGPDAGAYRVGPLARLNVADRLATAAAGAELARYRSDLGRYPASSFHYHYARLVELVHCVEAVAATMQRDDLAPTSVAGGQEATSTGGVGVREAPRGTLWHEYRVDDAGLVQWAGIVSATTQNGLYVNRALLEAARPHLGALAPNPGLFQSLEAVIRCYDPCLAASSHAIGEMPLTVLLRDRDGRAMGELSRA